MGLDDYAAGGGALRLKGAKVSKKKKKKDKSSKPTDLEKNLSTGESKQRSASPRAEKHDDDGFRDRDEEEEREREREPMFEKTESERRHEEARKKRLLQITQAGGSRPELLKTHKERVEKLNTYLSKLSEHHDMPKIGPG